MPELLFFLPCQKAVIDQQTNELSLIGVMDQVVPLLREGDETAEDTQSRTLRLLIAPFHVATVWRRKNNDEINMRIEQSVIMIVPDGKEIILAEAFSINLSSVHNRIIQPVPPFTARMPGNYRLSLNCRFDEGEWLQNYSEYSFHIHTSRPSISQPKKTQSRKKIVEEIAPATEE